MGQNLPELADVVVALVDGELARPHGVEGRRVAGVLEVGAVVARRLPARLRDCKTKIFRHL